MSTPPPLLGIDAAPAPDPDLARVGVRPTASGDRSAGGEAAERSAEIAAACLVATRGLGLEHRAALLARWPDPRAAVAAIRANALRGAGIGAFPPRTEPTGSHLVPSTSELPISDRLQPAPATAGGPSVTADT